MRKFPGLMLVILLLSLMAVPVAALPQTCTGGTHVVQPGENLFRISLRYNVDMWALARANGITNPNHVYVGQRLVIPCGGQPAPPPAPSGKIHVVQRGEFLSLIAARYGVNMWAIARANGITNPSHIYVGQRLIIPGVPPTPAPRPKSAPTTTPSTGAWHGEYFKGTEPTGGPVFTRNSSVINFHWGLGSPDPRLCCDEFSTRWSRNINFIGGLYRFTLTVDDGGRIWVDDRLVLDAWKVQSETTYTVDVTLSKGYHTITIEYFEQEGNATAQFNFKRLGSAPTPEPAPPGDAEWQATYYANRDLADPGVKTVMQPAINFDWSTGAPFPEVPTDGFSVRWTRNVGFESRTYAFCAHADDGVRLFVDDQLVIDEWRISDGSFTVCRDYPVSGGLHGVRVEYFEETGRAMVKVWWEKK
ncbi:MAG: LysM peptidoglycan-binding domain-containing protein [Anaerolineae bacterium]